MLACIPAEDSQAPHRILPILLDFTARLDASTPNIYIDLGNQNYVPKLAQDILSALSTSKLLVRMGVSYNLFVSLVAAHQAEPGRLLAVHQYEAPKFLEPQQIRFLPITQENHRRLRLLGLNTLGRIAYMPRSALCYQFGRQGLLMSNLAQGIDPTPLTLYRQPTDVIGRYRQLSLWYDQTRAVYSLTPIEVTPDPIGQPQAVHLQNQWLSVNSIAERWEQQDNWWRNAPIDRRCFEVILANEDRLAICQDLRTGQWHQLIVSG